MHILEALESRIEFMTDLQSWWDGTVRTITFRVIDYSLPASTQPLKVTLTADGDVMVFPNDPLQVWSGNWSSTHRNTINLDFPVMVAGQPNILIEHQVILLLHTNIYASTTAGIKFMLTPWQPAVAGQSFEDIITLVPSLSACPRFRARLQLVESGCSSRTEEEQ